MIKNESKKLQKKYFSDVTDRITDVKLIKFVKIRRYLKNF